MFWRKKNRPRCTNAEPGTFNHECGKPARWVGRRKSGLRQTFCDDCKERGWEARGVVAWEKLEEHAVEDAQEVENRATGDPRAPGPAATALYLVSATLHDGSDASLIVEAGSPDQALHLFRAWHDVGEGELEDRIKVFRVPDRIGRAQVRDFFTDAEDVTP